MKRSTQITFWFTALTLFGCAGPDKEPDDAVVGPGEAAHRGRGSEPSLAEWEAVVAERSREQRRLALEDPPTDARNQRRLGGNFYTGEGLDPDHAAAREWFQKAADQGEDVAQMFLGMMYRDGQGVDQSNVQAYLWFSLSAEQGNPGARVRLRELSKRMAPPELVEARKLADEWMPTVRDLAPRP